MANFSLKQRLAPGGKVTVVLLKHSLSARTVRHQSGHRCPVSVVARAKGKCCTNATYDPICYIRNQVYSGLNLAD